MKLCSPRGTISRKPCPLCCTGVQGAGAATLVAPRGLLVWAPFDSRHAVLAKRDRGQAREATVLVVDDDPLVLRTFQRILAERHTVETCATAHDAIARIACGGIDVVVTDLSMPGLSGVDLLRAVRTRSPNMPIIIVTGSPTAESEAEATALGAFEYLVKPIALEQLWRTVELAIRRCVARQTRS